MFARLVALFVFAASGVGGVRLRRDEVFEVQMDESYEKLYTESYNDELYGKSYEKSYGKSYKYESYEKSYEVREDEAVTVLGVWDDEKACGGHGDGHREGGVGAGAGVDGGLLRGLLRG